ncbi:hypothetical protein SDC9_74432 [bioreactor metagenome]|uniref:Uncharacterized protein n=1 Tax=bioreactor metagenome TaxID=1076179 RepID=A0A644YHE3_9ZZZZ
MGQHVPDVAHAREIHHHPLKSKAEARVLAGTVPPKVTVPPVILRVHAQLPDAALQQLQPLFALAAADNLADPGNQAVRCGDGLSVVVHAHIERLDLLGIVRDKNGLLEHLLRQESLVFRLKVSPPLHLIVKPVVVLLQDLHGLGVAHPAKVGGCHMLQALLQALVHKAVEKVHLIGAAFHGALDDELDHGLRHVHIAFEVGKGHLRLDHPELGGVALGVGVLRPESRAKGVHIAESHGKVLRVQLARNRQIRGLSEKVLGIVHPAVLGAGRIFHIQRGDPEHLASAFTVAGGDNGGMHIDETLALEKLMDGIGRDAPHPEGGGKQIRPGPQVLNRAEELRAMALFLKGIIGGGGPLHLDLRGLQLQRLLGVGSQYHRAGDQQRRAHVLRYDPGVVHQIVRVQNYLQILEVGAVVQLHEAEVLHVPDGAGPAAHGDLPAGIDLAVGENCRDFCHTHFSFTRLFVFGTIILRTI